MLAPFFKAGFLQECDDDFLKQKNCCTSYRKLCHTISRTYYIKTFWVKGTYSDIMIYHSLEFANCKLVQQNTLCYSPLYIDDFACRFYGGKSIVVSNTFCG